MPVSGFRSSVVNLAFIFDSNDEVGLPWLKPPNFPLRKRSKSCAAARPAMTDLQAKLEQYETIAADCELITKLATDGAKRELYLRLALHYRELVADIRKAIATKGAAW